MDKLKAMSTFVAILDQRSLSAAGQSSSNDGSGTAESRSCVCNSHRSIGHSNAIANNGIATCLRELVG